MCVIVYKPKHVSVSKKDFTAMYNSNPHGVGLAYRTISGVKVIKGLITLDRAWQTVNKLQNLELVIHFRYATHGEINAQQTHPFAVTELIADAKAYNVKNSFNTVLFHNGILSEFGNKAISDTLDMTTSILAKLESFDDQVALLTNMHGKFALMDKDSIQLIGDFEKYRGLIVSNTHFVITHTVPTKYTDQWLVDREYAGLLAQSYETTEEEQEEDLYHYNLYKD